MASACLPDIPGCCGNPRDGEVRSMPEEKFISADTDGDKCLKWDELKAYTESQGIKLDTDQTPFEKADTDSDGCLNMEEAMAWYKKQDKTKEGE